MKETNEKSLEQIEEQIARIKAELNDVHGTETEVYARIVGYYRAVKNWNKGKRDEFTNRKLFTISEISEEKSSNTIQQEITSSCENSEAAYYELYTKTTCPNCPPVKEYMKTLPSYIKAININVDTDEGLEEAASKGVFASPTAIIYDNSGNEIARGHNVEELSEIFEKILVKETV